MPEPCRRFPLSPSEGKGLGRGVRINLGFSGRIHWGLLSPALSSLGGRRGRSRRVSRVNFSNSMAVLPAPLDLPATAGIGKEIQPSCGRLTRRAFRSSRNDSTHLFIIVQAIPKPLRLWPLHAWRARLLLHLLANRFWRLLAAVARCVRAVEEGARFTLVSRWRQTDRAGMCAKNPPPPPGISIVLSPASPIRTPCTRGVQGKLKGCSRLRRLYTPRASGVLPLYTPCTRRE